MPLVDCLGAVANQLQIKEVTDKVDALVKKGKHPAEAEAIAKREFISDEFGKLNDELNGIKKEVGVKAGKVEKLKPVNFAELNKKYKADKEAATKPNNEQGVQESDTTKKPQGTESQAPKKEQQKPEKQKDNSVVGENKIPFNDFQDKVHELLVNQKKSEFELRLTNADLSQAEREKGVADIKAGKNTAAARKVQQFTKDLYDSGKLTFNRGRGNQAESFSFTHDEWFNNPLSKEELDLIPKVEPLAASIIKSEGITLDNIDNFKHLFDGFPYEESDFNAVKDYLAGQGERGNATEPISEESPQSQAEQQSQEITQPINTETDTKIRNADKDELNKTREDFLNQIEELKDKTDEQSIRDREHLEKQVAIIDKFGMTGEELLNKLRNLEKLTSKCL